MEFLHNVLDLYFLTGSCFVILQLQKFEDVIQLCEQNLDTSRSNIKDFDLQSSSLSIPWSWSVMIKALFYMGRLEDALDFVKKQEEFLPLNEK